MLKSQTSTEYLIILAVVIIIALIVVGVLGGIPGIGGGAGESASRAALAAQTLGITGYSITDYDTTVTVRNNNKDAARINSMSIDGQKCGFVSNVRLAPGETRQIDCPNVYELEQSRAEYAIVINWTDIKTQTNFTQSDPSLKIASEVGSEYLGVLDNTPGFSFASKGCWDASAEPHPICTCYDLNLTRTQLSWNYTLQNSIDFDRCMEYFGDAGWTSEVGWTPIAECVGVCGLDGDETPYTGMFDGDSYVISGLFIDQSGTDNLGLFGLVGGTLKNVGIDSVDITGNNFMGGLSAYVTNGYVDNSYASGSIVSAGGGTGGMIGTIYPDGTVENSYAQVDITLSNGVNNGGLVGYLSGSVDNCYTTGDIQGSFYAAGGLIGYASVSSSVSNSHATGDVRGDGVNSDFIGGLIAYSSADIENSYATGDVIGSNYIGGLVGALNSVTIDNSYATGSVTCTGTEWCGGLVGQPVSLTLTGTNTWVDHSGDTADGCVGQSGTITGTSAANCSP